MLHRVLPKSKEEIKETHYQHNSCQNVEITLSESQGGEGKEFSLVVFGKNREELNVFWRKQNKERSVSGYRYRARSQILCLYKETQSKTIPVQIAGWATRRLASQRSHYDSGTENLLLAILKRTPSGKARLYLITVVGSRNLKQLKNTKGRW